MCARFTVKVKNAQNAGAIGVVVGNNADVVAGMSGVDATITIPAVLHPALATATASSPRWAPARST